MADITEELRVLVTAEVDKAVKNLTQLDQKTQKTTSDFETLGKAIGAAFLAKEVIDFGKASVRASEDARQKFSLLKTTIDTTGAAAWTSIDAMAQMSKELSDATNYSVSEIQSMQTVLLGFKNITGDTFEEASGAIMDMATVMGMDLKSAVQTVGKALDDPINGIDSLKRQGFAFTDSQKSMLKAMVATGNQAGAQKLILDELSTTYGGAAKAAQTSFAKMEHAMDELKESVGNILTPLLADIAENAVELLEKFNSLDEGTQRVIVTTTGLVALAPAVVTAIGGVKKALMALQAANPVLLGISAGAAALIAIADASSKASHALEDERKQIAKSNTAANSLLKSFADGNEKKELDAKTTKKLIELYPQLSGEITAYKTTVEEAAFAQKKLNDQKILDNAQGELKNLAKLQTEYQKWNGWIKDVEDSSKNLQKIINENPKSGLNFDRKREIEANQNRLLDLQAGAEEAKDKVDEKVAEINKSLAQIGKTLKGNTIVELELDVSPESLTGSLESNQSSIAKSWHEWLSKTLKIDESLFKTGEEAANLYIDGLEKTLSNAEGVSEILGKKFSATDIIDSQLSEIEGKINELLNIQSPLIDQVFSKEELEQEGTALNALYQDYQNLQNKKAGSLAKDLQKEIDDLGKSEFQLYLEANNVTNASEEEIARLKELYDTLELESADSWTDKLSLSIEDALEKFDVLDTKSRKVLADMATNFANISLDSAMTGFEEFGRALGEGEDAADSMSAALAAMAQQILKQLPMLFLQAGLQLIAQGMWPLGLGLIAAAGSSAIFSGYVDGSTSSNSTKSNALGGVYGADDYAAFAKGGTFTNTIVQSPTFFKFAKGSGFGTGLMGEAGPEAIMPLTRGVDGSLGVNASGLGANVEVKIPVTVYSDEPVEVNDTTDESGQRKIEIMVGSMINKHLSDGSADRALKSRYGLKVQGV
ncbi:MAG: phage tail length tape measure family protein [Succinivibrionaceae bacterium]|nr:phage tail length tape measure family protein [Succinivibrionaceae bacterium]